MIFNSKGYCHFDEKLYNQYNLPLATAQEIDFNSVLGLRIISQCVKIFFLDNHRPNFLTVISNFMKPRIWTKFELLFDLLHFCPNQQVDVKSGGIKYQVKNKDYIDLSALGMAGKTRSLNFNQFFFLCWQEMMRKICIWRHKTQK